MCVPDQVVLRGTKVLKIWMKLPFKLKMELNWASTCILCRSSEKRLHSMNQLLDHPNIVEYFWPDRPMAQIQDDHVPFLNRGMLRTHLIAVTPSEGWWLAVCSDRPSLLVSARCPRPPSHPLPLPLRLAHFWWQRAELGPSHHSEPEQDPAGFCSGVPQHQTHCCYKPTECWVNRLYVVQLQCQPHSVTSIHDIIYSCDISVCVCMSERPFTGDSECLTFFKPQDQNTEAPVSLKHTALFMST